MPDDFISPEDLMLFTSAGRFMTAAVYLQSRQQNTTATFDLFIREAPTFRNYFVVAGLEHILDYLLNFRFTKTQLQYIQDSFSFPNDVFNYFTNMRFTGDVWAMPEGTICFPNEPVIRITAPIIEAQMIEQYLVNTVMLQTMLASKLARVVNAAQDKHIAMTFTRSHGVEPAVKAVRVGKIVGVNLVGLPISSMRYGIPMTGGTTFHHFFQSFDTELEAFETYIRLYPGKGWILIDTYDAQKGLETLISVGKKYGSKPVQGIFLDSGDLLEWSSTARTLLDEAGMHEVKIMVMSNLEEYKIDALVKAGAPVDWYGVATEVMTSSDAPKLEVVYKLCEVIREGKRTPKMKLASKKLSLPGVKQVRRIYRDGKAIEDIIALDDEPIEGEELLVPWIQHGKRVRPTPSLEESHAHYVKQKACFDPELFVIDRAHAYPVRVSPGLQKLADTTRKEIEKKQKES